MVEFYIITNIKKSNENITLLNNPNDHREEIDAIVKYLKKYPNPYGIKKHMNENNFKNRFFIIFHNCPLYTFTLIY